jgi:hypothetical protein
MKPVKNSSSVHLVSSGRRPARREHISAYRPYTRALLRRYFRLAVDLGRLPSILGGLCFRARVSSYRLHTFEDSVIFVYDIERVFERIDRPAMEIVAGVVLLEYSIPEAALRLGITVQRAERRYASALDSLSEALLDCGLLCPVFESGEDGPGGSPCGALPSQKSPASADAPSRIRSRPPASGERGQMGSPQD